MTDASNIRVWPRADGWIEVETPTGPVRFKTDAEVDAYLAGLKNGLGIGQRLISDLIGGTDAEVIDDRPIKPAPRGES